jgi:hypothetical protein
MSFFATKNAVELADRTMLYQPDLYAAKVMHEQETSVLDSSTPTAATFTLDSGIVTADDVFNSTSLQNLYFLDNNNALAKVEIDDSSQSGNTVTFDSTAAVLVSDESTAPTLTDTNSYQVRVLQASSNALTFGSSTIPVGLYLGDTSDLSINYTNNEAKLKTGVPKKLRAKGTVEIEASLEFNFAQITDPGMLEAALRGATIGSQTNQTQIGYGFDPQVADRYMIQAWSKDNSGRAFFMEFFLCEIMATSIGFGGDEFKQIGVNAELLADVFRPDASNMFRSISLD